MAFVQSSFFSRSLQMIVSLNVILPEFGREEESQQPPQKNHYNRYRFFLISSIISTYSASARNIFFGFNSKVSVHSN